jgi:hypothetical protein
VVSIKYITTTLHQAIDAYSLRLKNTGKTDEDGNLVARVNKCRDRLRYLKQAHKDLPLWRLDLTQLSEIIAHWRNRPRTQKGKCYANLPFRKLFEATKELHGHFRPMLDALKAPS